MDGKYKRQKSSDYKYSLSICSSLYPVFPLRE